MPNRRCVKILRGASPLLSLLRDGFLVAPCHLGLGGGFSGRSDLNGRVLKWSCGHGHFIPTLRTKQYFYDSSI